MHARAMKPVIITAWRCAGCSRLWGERKKAVECCQCRRCGKVLETFAPRCERCRLLEEIESAEETISSMSGIRDHALEELKALESAKKPERKRAK